MKKHFPAFALAFIAVLFFLLGILRLNDLSLYTDSTRYLAWGNSIAHGNGFVDDTQPVPEYYVVNAPLYSAVLAPVLAIFPMSLAAAKVWTLLWGVLSIILFYFLMRRMTSVPTALLAAVFFAFNPLTLTLCTEVLSEAPFLCCTLFSFTSAGKYFRKQYFTMAKNAAGHSFGSDGSSSRSWNSVRCCCHTFSSLQKTLEDCILLALRCRCFLRTLDVPQFTSRGNT